MLGIAEKRGIFGFFFEIWHSGDAWYLEKKLWILGDF
jgi:hypothetical protein